MAPVIETFPDGEWVDITGRLRHEAGLLVERGRVQEYDSFRSLLQFVADNRSPHIFSSDVPGTTYYKKLGRGTPIRVSDTVITDTFTRTTSDGWGSTEDPGTEWYTIGTASHFSVNGSEGRYTLTTPGFAYATGVATKFRDVQIRCSVQIGALTTVSPCWVGVVTRATPGDLGHYRFELEFQNSGNVKASIIRRGGPGEASLEEVVIDDTYTAGTTFELRALSVGRQHYFKVWLQGTTEPEAWTVEVEDVHLRTGYTGTRAARGADNGEANLTVDFDNFVVSDPLFFGEIWSMRPMADTSGKDLTATVEASGILRRLSNTAKALRSPLFRTLSTGDGVTTPTTAPVAYWSLEDGRLATQLEARFATPGVIIGEVEFAADSDLDGSAPLPVASNQGNLAGIVPAYTGFDAATDEWSITWLAKIDEAEEQVIGGFGTYGDVSEYQLAMTVGGSLVLRGVAPTGLVGPFVWGTTEDYNAATTAAGEASLFGQWVRFRLSNTESAGTYEVKLEYGAATTDGAVNTISSGFSASVWREPRGVWRLAGPPEGSTAFGHVAFWDVMADVSHSVVNGWPGETARARFLRLCSEENIPALAIGSESESMGPQLMGTLLANLEDVAATDLGILRESKHLLGLEYRTRTTLYNQVPFAAVDCSASELTDGLAPIRDDAQGLANSVHATRDGGTAQTFTIADGDIFHLTTQDPPDGIGLVETSIAPNVETDQHAAAQAAWHAHLRSWREPRYEQLTMFLHSGVYRANAQQSAYVSGVDIGDCAQLANQSAWVPPDPIEELVQGIRRYSDGIRKQITWNCTPAVPWEVWSVDGTSTIIGAKDSDDTQLKLATSAGPEWIEDPDPPFLIQINGEAMAVTGVTTDTATFVGAGTADTDNNASLTPTAHASTAAGNLMVLAASIRNSGTGTVDTPSGWELKTAGGTNFELFTRYYVDGTGNDAPTVSFTGGAAGADTIAQIATFSGCSAELDDGQYGESDVSPQAQLNSSAQNIAYPSLSVRRDGCVVIYAGWKQDDWTSVATVGDAEIGEPDATAGSDAGMVWAYDIQTTATDVTAGSFSVTGGISAISRGIVLALRPLQTVTVERSVNGVVQSIAAGEAVHVWRHGALPL